MNAQFKYNVSIIMPVYDEGQFLDKSIQAIINQEYSDWELIIIDDGSNDNSLEIAERYAKDDFRIKVIHQENRGVSMARNCGLSIASGNWIWFVDSDDQIAPEFLGTVFSRPISEKVNVIAGNYEKISGNIFIEEIELCEQGLYGEEYIPDLFMKYQYKNGFWGYLWNKLIRHSLIQYSRATFKKDLTLAEDLKFMIQIYRNCACILLVPYIAMKYTISNDEKAYNKNIDYYEQLIIQFEIYQWIVIERKRVKYEEFLKSIISNYAAFMVFYAFEDGEDYIGVANKIYHWPEVYNLLIVDGSTKVMRIIIYCLIHKDTRLLWIFLNIRNMLRRFYRLIFYRE